MKITLIAAMTVDHGIGRDGSLPWHLPDDLKRFRRLTIGKPIVMGRKTWASLPRRPLPDRHNIVLSRSMTTIEGVTVVRSFKEAIGVAQADMASEMVVIGGGEIYAMAIPFADRLELTWIRDEIEGCDAFFPPIDPNEWSSLTATPSPNGDALYMALERKRGLVRPD